MTAAWRHRCVPDARLLPLESRNHILLDTDEAWEQFAGEIDEFLSVPGDNSPAIVAGRIDGTRAGSLEYVAQGLTNGAISKRLKIAEKTVRNHVSIILSKLGVVAAHTQWLSGAKRVLVGGLSPSNRTASRMGLCRFAQLDYGSAQA